MPIKFEIRYRAFAIMLTVIVALGIATPLGYTQTSKAPHAIRAPKSSALASRSHRNPGTIPPLQFTATTYPVIQYPTFVTSADLNGDGIPDLMVGSHFTQGFSILFGNGDGTFKPANNFFATGYASSIAVGDFNGDGKPDLAVGGLGIVILINNGDGTFSQGSNLNTVLTLSVTTGDFNGDGKLDIAASDANNDTVSILLGNGDGTFQPAVSYATGHVPEVIVAGDFNNDGVLDLATANEFQSTTVNNPGTMTVLLGNGDGTFKDYFLFNAGNGPFGIAVGDFNGDGNLDSVVANTDQNAVSLFLGKGNGDFQPATSVTADQGCISVVVGDFNLDGKLDLAVSNANGNDVSVLLGNGDGTFQSPLQLPAGTAPYGVAAGDFNRDGHLDLVSANYVDSTITVFLNVYGPSVALSSSALSFGDQLVGTVSSSPTVTLTNTGTAPLTIASLRLAGTNSSDFSQSNTCGTSVAPGASCTINVTFNPVSTGFLSASIVIADNATNSPQSISLKGSGTSIQLTPASVRFGSQSVGTQSAPKKITILNTGSVTVNLSSVSITGANAGDFSQTNTCSKRLVAAGSCYVTVTFTPSAKGNRTAAISVTDNGGGSPQSAPLIGAGT
jgi:hypothetical protein